jgi:hypothetical protein
MNELPEIGCSGDVVVRVRDCLGIPACRWRWRRELQPGVLIFHMFRWVLHGVQCGRVHFI